MLVQDIFRDTKARIFHIHLNENLAIPLVEAFVGLDAAIHLRGALNLSVAIQFQLRVYTADVFTADKSDPRDGGTDGKVLPVLLGDEGRT